MSDRIAIVKEFGGVFQVRWSMRTFGADNAVELEVFAGETIMHCWRCIIGDRPSRMDPSRPTLPAAMLLLHNELSVWIAQFSRDTTSAAALCGKLLERAVGGEVP